MPTCPECYSNSVYSAVGSPEEKTDGQGYAWTIIYHYECESCGCVWDETEKTTRIVEVVEHGKDYEG